MTDNKLLLRRRILIVEDDEIMTSRLEILLTHLGYDVVDSCSSGEQAVKSALAFNPDLVLMDIVLETDMDGVDTANRIRDFRKIPIIYITAHTDDAFFERAALTEPFGYIVKPYEERELEATLRIAFHHSDIEKKLARSEKHLSDAQRIGMLGSWNWDIINNRLEWSDQMFRLFDLEPQVFGANYESFIERVHPEDRDHVTLAVNSALAGEKHFCINYRVILGDSQVRCIHAEGEVSRDADGTPLRMIGTANDVTAFQETQNELWHMAYHDPLTGLPNRALFSDRLQQSISRADRTGEHLAVLLMDLDGFKNINDSHGHDTGDQLLIEVANRVKSVLRGDDTLARIGGDEFLCILNTIHNVEEALLVSRKIIETIKNISMIDRQWIKIGCSVGIALYPSHGDDSGTLVKKADTAMYQAKHRGKATCCIYNEEDQTIHGRYTGRSSG